MGRLFSIIFILCLGGAVARADTFQVFDVTGSLFMYGVLSGTLTLDTTLSQFTAENLAVVFSPPNLDFSQTSFVFNSITSTYVQHYYNGYTFPYVYSAATDPSTGAKSELTLLLPSGGLIGYTGSMICSQNYSCALSGEFSGLIENSPNLFTAGLTSGCLHRRQVCLLV